MKGADELDDALCWGKSCMTMSSTKTIIIVAVVFILNVTVEVIGIQPHQQAQKQTKTKNTLFPILFESPRVLVVRKPYGVGHHDELALSSENDDNDDDNDNANDNAEDVDVITPGVLRLLRDQRQQQSEDVEGERLYGVHRLDKVTSGILVFAKDASTASTLSDYFARGEIQKVYFGLSVKKPQKKKQGLVQGGMARSRNKSWKLVRKTTKDGKKSHHEKNFAKTRFFTTGLDAAGIVGRVVGRGGDNNNNTSNVDPITNVKTVAMFRPYTGKTHQLRVAAKAMGIPLLGDPIYKDGGGSRTDDNNNVVTTSTSSSSTTTRTMLHASGIHIPGFLDQDEINVWCPPTFFFDDDDEDAIIQQTDDDDMNMNMDQRQLLANSLDMAVEKLMTKNCDVPGILDTMTMMQQQQEQ